MLFLLRIINRKKLFYFIKKIMKCITFNARLKYLIKFYFLRFILNRKAFSTLIYSRYFFFFFLLRDKK